jgi:hypothetical protein
MPARRPAVDEPDSKGVGALKTVLLVNVAVGRNCKKILFHIVISAADQGRFFSDLRG